jgi:hypothetical protein
MEPFIKLEPILSLKSIKRGLIIMEPFFKKEPKIEKRVQKEF